MLNLIEWEAHGKALAKLPYLQRVIVTKLIHGWNATKRRRYRDGSVLNSRCQLCNNEEDAKHICVCSHETLKQQRGIEINTVIDKLEKMADPSVTRAIKIGIENIGAPQVTRKYAK